MKIQEIYDNYKIMPQMQLHQLRVAGVASIITDNFEGEIDKHSIVSACLIHDIGNIVKFDLKRFPDHLEPQGLEFWKNVQENYFKKYGRDDYKATYKILKEIGIDDNLFELINNMEFRKAPENSKKVNFEIKITQYSDMRVAPYGVTLTEDRLEEVQNRFMKNKGIDEKVFNKYKNGVLEIEKQIFERCEIDPEVITNKKVEPLIDELRNYKVL